MDIQLRNATDIVIVADNIFNVDFNEALIHQVVTSFFQSTRAGTKAQKTRSEVSGGGTKPWKQKGTGRARAGTIRSPIWRSGGVAFAAKPRNYNNKINKKMYRAAIRSIFSELNRQKRLIVVEDFSIIDYKTKSFLKFSMEYGLGSDVLLIQSSIDHNLLLASRNIPNIELIDVQKINPVILLRHEMVAIDKLALEKVNEWLSV